MKSLLTLLALSTSLYSQLTLATSSVSVKLSDFKVSLDAIDPSSGVTPSITGLSDLWLNGGTLSTQGGTFSSVGIESNTNFLDNLNVSTSFTVGENTKATFSLLATYNFFLQPPQGVNNWYQEDGVTFSGVLGVSRVNGGFKSFDNISNVSSPFDSQWRGGKTVLDSETGEFQYYDGWYSENGYEYQESFSVSFVADEYVFSHACPFGVCTPIPPSLVMYSDLTGIFEITSNSQSRPVPSLVPEPETYMMFMAGIGLVGFATKRKRKLINSI